MPVIQPSALEILVFQAIAQRLNQMQLAARRRTGSGNIAGILRNLRLNQDDMKHVSFIPFLFLFHCISVFRFAQAVKVWT